MNLTDQTIIEQWQGLAVLLPILVGALIRPGMSDQSKRVIAFGIYAIFGLLGSFLKGDLDGLSWGSVQAVLTSIVIVASIGFASYQWLWKAFPLPAAIERMTAGNAEE